MVLPRPTVLRGFAPARLLRAAPRTANRAVSRRGYASSHGGHAEPSSDLPWAIAAVAVTLPTCFYLWPSQTHADAHHPETVHERSEKLTHEADEPTPEEEPAQGDMAVKQQGLSNDETAHSTPVSENPEKSKKGDGSAETAKAEGTVDSEGPLTESRKTESNDKSEDKSEEKSEEKPEEKKSEEKPEEKKDDKPEEKKSEEEKPEEKKDDKPEEEKKDE